MAVSALSMILLNIVASGQIDPLSSTMSNYVFVADVGWLFPLSVLGMAAGGFGVLAGLGPSTSGLGRLARVAVWLATVCCLLVALCPTNRTAPLTLSAEIHRYAAGVAFCCVPIAALLVASLPGSTATHGRWLRRTALGTSCVLAIFLLSHLGPVPEPVRDLRGLFQRILFLAQLLTLARLLLCRPRPYTSRARLVDTLPARSAWPSLGIWPAQQSTGTNTPKSPTESMSASPLSR